MAVIFTPAYPTPAHAAAAQAAVEFLGADARVETVLLTNSCARGKASKDSCLDLAALVRPDVWAADGRAMDAAWEQFQRSSQVIFCRGCSSPAAFIPLPTTNGFASRLSIYWACPNCMLN